MRLAEGAKATGQERPGGVNRHCMDIHFVSTLTPEDEDRFAPVLINTLRAILKLSGIPYTLRIETANRRVFQDSGAGGGGASYEEPLEPPPTPHFAARQQ